MLTGKESPKIVTSIPGPTAKKIIEKDKKFIATSTKCSPIAVKCAKGSLVEDVDGNIFLDFTSGVSVVNTGHCHPAIVETIRKQAGELMHFAGTDFYYDIQSRLAEKLCEITPGKFEKKVFFTNSGTESVEAAIKISRWSTGRKRFISFIGGFHGRTMGSLALTCSKAIHRERFFPTMPGVTHVPYPNPYRNPFGIDGYENPSELINTTIEFIRYLMEKNLPPKEVASIFFEPVQGEGGYIVPPSGFAKELKKLADEYGILLVDDEIQAGFGRTGKMFAIQHYGIEPDILTLAKGIASGMPMGACVFNAEYDFDKKGAHSNTFGGNLVAASAALTTIEVLEKGLIKNAAKMGKLMKKRLEELNQKWEQIGDARGIGLMRATEFVKENKEPAEDYKDEIIKRAYEKGLLLLPCGESTIRYIPPLNITEEQLNEGMDILEEAMKETFS